MTEDLIMKQLITRILLLLLLASSLTCPSQAYTQEEQQHDRQMIEKITLVAPNNSSSTFDEKAVLSRMKTKAGDLFSQEDFDNDLKTLSGEFDRVEPSLELVQDKLYITLNLWPKPMIRTLNWNGNESLKTKKLQKELGIKPNTVFERQEFNTAFHKLKALYVKRGFFEAELSYRVVPDPCTNDVDVTIDICEGRSGRIKDIVFKNFSDKEESELLEMIMTKRYNLFISWMNNEGTYRDELIQQDELIIIDYLQNQGYADAQVHINIVECKQRNRIVVEIEADKGVPYTFGQITFEGNCILNNEEVQKCFLVKEGSCFSPTDMRQTSQIIMAYYGSKGYIDTYVSFEPRLDPENPVYNIHFIIEEGEQYRVGMINVIGNNCTQTSVILHETLLCPGEVFNLNLLKLTEQRLLNIGYFKNVNVYAMKSDAQCPLGSNYRDVIIEVEETSTGNFSAFVGFSTAESIFGGINVTERNFNILGLPDLFSEGYSALRGGGEYAHITATIGQRQRSYVFSWTKPFFMDTPWIVGFDIEKSTNKIVSRHYCIESLGLTLHAKYPINQFLKVGLQYRLRDTDVKVPEDSSPRLLAEAHNSGLISAVGVSLIYDSTDDLKPSKGLRSRLESEYAGLGGLHTFFGFGYINTYYYRLHCDGILKFRADARFIAPVGNTTLHSLPLDERLYLGGETTVRGYRPFSIGPQFDNGDPSGGLSQTLFSIEYDYEIFSRLDAFVFFDTGQVSCRAFSIDDFRYAVGYGVRLKILEGGPPLIIGMGYPLNPASDNQVKKFFLSIGARF